MKIQNPLEEWKNVDGESAPFSLSPSRGEGRGEGPRSFSHWDLWYLALLREQFGGSWDAFAARLKADRAARLSVREDAEAKLSHLHDLRERIESIGETPATLLEDEIVTKALLLKARRRVLESEPDPRNYSPAMHHTPRRRFADRAKRGYWDRFPVSPAAPEPAFARIAQAKGGSLDASFRLRDLLEETREKHAKLARTPAQSLALLRAMLTVTLETVERADDSCGVLAQLFAETLRSYLAIPWRDTGIDAAVYYRDLLEFAIWEDHGLITDDAPLFKRVTADLFPLVDSILQETRTDLLRAGFEHQAETALTLRGTLHVAKRKFAQFEALAAEMGSREWERITAMAEAAWKAGKEDLARRVFTAADQPGFHQKYLRERCAEITGGGTDEPRRGRRD